MHLHTSLIKEEKVHIGNIPAILFRPKEDKEKFPTIIFYHGWSSYKEAQRIRGLILATVGFQVLIPDAIYHGERNPIDYWKNTYKFWEVVFNNIEESSLLIEALVSKYDADPDNISLIGHSMGGFTSAGIFTYNPKIKSVVILNGSFAWDYYNQHLIKELDIEITDKLHEIGEKAKKLDPSNKLEALVDRPILMLHGRSDSLVPVDNQRLFYQKIEPLYKDKEKIKLIEYPNLDHFVTTNMMEQSIIWFKKYGI
ncbi:MAG: prolyl oligopeptidase family serine peptidase [Tissierellia bacterium]|nr:prolyl oligopeptidase family serine peptidase [Tissierellia bacterium]